MEIKLMPSCIKHEIHKVHMNMERKTHDPNKIIKCQIIDRYQ